LVDLLAAAMVEKSDQPMVTTKVCRLVGLKVDLTVESTVDCLADMRVDESDCLMVVMLVDHWAQQKVVYLVAWKVDSWDR
jgi:hypothetical protein